MAVATAAYRSFGMATGPAWNDWATTIVSYAEIMTQPLERPV